MVFFMFFLYCLAYNSRRTPPSLGIRLLAQLTRKQAIRVVPVHEMKARWEE